jgi:hypothetical protein
MVIELAGEPAQPVKREFVIVSRPCRAQPALDRGPVALGQVLQHISFLVAKAPMHRHIAEHLAHRGPQRLAAVEHHEHALLDVHAAIDEVGQQRDGDRLVLGRAVPQAQCDLDRVGRDPQRPTQQRPLSSIPSSINAANRMSAETGRALIRDLPYEPTSRAASAASVADTPECRFRGSSGSRMQRPHPRASSCTSTSTRP